MTAEQLHPSARRVIRRVRILDPGNTEDRQSKVVALNGPLRGCEYYVDARNLRIRT